MVPTEAKMEQLEDDIGSTAIKFSQEELVELNEISKLLSEYPTWMLERTGGNKKL